MLLIVRLIDLYSLIVLVAVIVSWIPVDRRNPLVSVLRSPRSQRWRQFSACSRQWEDSTSPQWCC
jgi:hypothetical protein